MLSKYSDSDNGSTRRPQDTSLADIAGNLAAVSRLMASVMARLSSMRSDMARPLEAVMMRQQSIASSVGASSKHGSLLGGSDTGQGNALSRPSMGARPMALGSFGASSATSDHDGARASVAVTAASTRQASGTLDGQRPELGKRRWRKAGDAVRSLNRCATRFTAVRDQREQDIRPADEAADM